MRKKVLFITLLISITISAQKSKIKDLERERKQTLQEISDTNKLLRDTKRSTSNLLDRIKLISNQIASRQKVVRLLGEEIENIEKEQVLIENDIVQLEGQLKEKQNSYAKAIDGMLRTRRGENKLLYILSGKSLTESIRRIRYLKDYSEWRSQQADDIKVKSKELQEKKQALAESKKEKQGLLNQRAIEQENLKNEEIAYKQEIDEAKKRQKELQKELAEKKKRAATLDRQISKLIAEEVSKQQKKTRKTTNKNTSKGTSKNTDKPAKDTNTNSSNSTEEAISVEDVKLSGNFTSNKGKLPYPITGNARVTSRFGTHRHSQWDVTTSSNGIDLQSQSGAEARSVFDGEVSRVVVFPGYNNCVIVRHGNYYSFYGNIKNMYVKQGDKVKAGQLLGKVYTDPDTNSSELHFQLWKGTNKLNPEPWLRK